MRVLIVDDEEFIAQHVGQMVSEHPDCTVVGLAFNGVEALSLMEKQSVDLVMTDIRMPVMDGITLLRQLREKYPQCLVVVLSGYSEFEYAKAALDHQACGYLLKPIIKHNLFPILDKVRTVWLEQHRVQRRQVLQQAMDGISMPQDDAEPAWLLISQTKGRVPERIFGENCFVFQTDNEQILVVDDKPGIPELAAQYLEHLKQDGPANLICTDRPIPVQALHKSTETLRSALKQRIKLFQSQLFLLDPDQVQAVRPTAYLRDLRPNRAVDAVCTKNQSDLQKCLLDVLQIPDIRQIDVMNYLHSVLSDVRLSYHMTPERLEQISQLLLRAVSDAAEPEPCAKALTGYLLLPYDQTEAAQSTLAIIRKIVLQLDGNCHLNFSTEVLARQHGMTPRTLNKAFKEYTGQRVMDYLVTKRMYRAKAILEAEPDVKVQDVAASLGYPDAHYFSRMFKRETGFSPKEVQKAAKHKPIAK